MHDRTPREPFQPIQVCGLPTPWTPAELAAMRAAADEIDLNAQAERLRSRGWIVCPPGHIPMPRDRDEAAKMHLIADRYLMDNPT